MAANYYAEWRRRMESNGVCNRCGNHPILKPGRKQCGHCIEERKEYRRILAEAEEMNRPLMTFDEIALSLGISGSRTRVIYANAIRKVYRKCKKLGIDAGDIVGRGFSSIALCEKWADG